jgi:hypothetical protein
VSDAAGLAPEAAVALGIASTAMPFARTSEEEVERWLRVLRLHGDAGVALQALGVGEAPLRRSHESDDDAGAVPAGERGDAVETVTAQAAALAGRRGAGAVGTGDLLRAVMRVYGEDFDRVLRAHGTDREEVEERLRACRSPSTLEDPRR